jgi:hypothetical protein
MRGEFIRGTGTNSHANQGSGAAVGTHQDGTSHRQEAFNSTSGWWGIYKATSDTTQYPMSISDYDSMVASAVGYISNANTYTAEVGAASLVTSRPTNTSVLFCIAYKDIYSNPMNDYSTDEKVVGTWINGEPLYQKTLQITMPSANESSISTGVENGNHARIVDGFIEQTGSSGGNYSFPAMFDSGSPLTTKVLIQVTVNGSNLYVYSNFDKTDGKTAYITIQYTKTT